MLAYVFWHWPLPHTEPSSYVDRLVAFHRVLRATPPPGFHGSRILAVEGAAWVPGAPVYEDWYLVDDWGALGALNEAAITASRKVPHDDVARMAGGGAGAVYRRLSVSARREGVSAVSWFGKPGAEGYAAFNARLPASTEVWQRQLVLGPAAEYCAFGPAPEGAGDATTVRVRVVDDST